MAAPVANAWTTGNSAVVHQMPQFRSSSCSCLKSSSSSSNLRFILGVSTSSTVLSNKSSSILVKRHHRKDSKQLLCRCTTSNNTSIDTTSTSTPSNSTNTNSSSSSDWDWSRWSRHFSEIEQAERCSSLLKFQLEEAIENEDFQEAIKLKKAIIEATSKDCIAEIMSQLKEAVDEERYHDASRLCIDTGSGLVGWWVGYSKDSDDPFGRIIRITPGVGRFVGRSYNPRQLVSASAGTPLFEIFVVKEADETYTMQVVFLQRAKASTEKSAASVSSISTKGPSATAVENASVIDVKVSEDKVGKSDEKSINIEGVTEEGIRSVINFLKDKIPELKLKDLKVMKVDVTEEVVEDNDSDNDSVKQLMEEDAENSLSSEDSEDETSDSDDTQPNRVALEEGRDAIKDGKDLDMKLFIGGVLHNKEDAPPKDEYVRVAAEIQAMERDSFMLHVPMRSRDHDTEESIASKVKVAAIAAQGISDLMPADVAKALWKSDKASSKVSRSVREIVKLAINQAKKGEKLSEYTNFSRISTTRGDLDPFDGLYVGAFGPYGTEVVQLRRKYGNWGTNDVEFFEYVEAVKLTGDLNVPAGQVTFRAKVAKGSRFSNRGVFPDELGVVASHRGQGRIADFGFKNPKWVEGELLVLNGKGMGPYVKGADLGFLYVIPDQSFLVLFNRLKLPE